jgi:monovalent cation:H+ antiporter-2, CPA2 family
MEFLIIAEGVVPPFLVEAVAIVGAAALIAYASYRIGLVPIVGFLLAGVCIGPHALALVDDPALVDAAAEVGVILLLFTIGIEFSLDRLARIKMLIFGGGGLQVALSSLAVTAILTPFGVDWRAALFTGFLVSLSSTAIVLKLIANRGETGSDYGQVSMGLLIFQDLAIIVMVLLVPMLGGGQGTGLHILLALAKAVGIILVVLVLARRLMPPLLERVALTCSPELFLLTVIAICFGTAWLTSVAGVSVSLGAFLAGLIVSESRFSHHAFGEIMPLQILFSATFFVSVGMLLNLGFLARNLPLVLGAVALVLVVKVATTAASVAALKYPAPVAAASALTLAQVGEFSFVLERAGRDAGLSPAALGAVGSQTFIAATVLLMVATPQLNAFGARLAERLGRRALRHAGAVVDAAETPSDTFQTFADHVIVAGFGDAARQLVRVLQGSGIPFVITTLSPGGANEAESLGLPVLRGDSSRQHTLLMAGVDRARMIVVADDDPPTAGRIVAVARSLAPTARIVVRTRYAADAAALTHDGADLVIAEELESVVQLFAQVLRSYAVPPEQIEAHEQAVRTGTYAALRAAVEASSATSADPDAVSRAAVPIDTSATIQFAPDPAAECSHLDAIRPVRPSARGCEECLRTGSTWVHLRICLSCGHVGCCDSSPNKHATAHHRRTGHPIVRSLEPGETWGWCYADEVIL